MFYMWKTWTRCPELQGQAESDGQGPRGRWRHVRLLPAVRAEREDVEVPRHRYTDENLSPEDVGDARRLREGEAGEDADELPDGVR